MVMVYKDAGWRVLQTPTDICRFLEKNLICEDPVV